VRSQRSEKGPATTRGAHKALFAVVILAFVAASAAAIKEWLALGARTKDAPAGRTADTGWVPPTTARASYSTFAPGTVPMEPRLITPPRASSRHHRRGRGHQVELDGISRESMGAELTAELKDAKPHIKQCMRATPGGDSRAAIRALRTPESSPEELAFLRELETASVAASHATPRTILLDVETGDGEVRIADVSPANDGAVFVTCARQELRGRVVPVPGAKAGTRTSVALPF